MTAKGKKTTLLLAIMVLFAAGFILVFGINQWCVTVTVNGSETIVVEYGEVYKDEGATARFHGSLIFKKGWPVEISEVHGDTDAEVTKKRSLIYYAEAFGKKSYAERILKVVDTQEPEIILKEIEGHYTLPGQPYEEEGFTAMDSCDGDLTNLVKVKEEDGFVYYTVEDSSGNKTEVVREIFYDDPEAPKLTLKGDASIILEAGTVYEEPGFTAMDNVEGDITNIVQVEGNVDEKVIGSYTIIYSVTDKYENTTTIQRTIQVVDTTAPALKLKGESKLMLEAGTTYTDKGYTAIDIVDGDLTSVVNVEGSVNTKKLGVYKIIYTVMDQCGNRSEAVRTIEVKDTTKPQIKLNGESKTTCNVGSSAYQDAGYVATDNLDGDITKYVKVSGTVDTKKLGTYTLTYTVSDSNGNSSKVTRTVIVKDTQAPKITLNGDTKIKLFLGTDYTEAGYTALDSFDGDVTDSVKVSGTVNKDKVGTYTITYSVTDKSGNKASVKRTITIWENIAPELTLHGESSVTISAGSKYKDPGYAATDNYDGNITSSVKVKGKVNVYQSGTYTLTYTVADSSGNTVSAKRTVVVKPVPQPDVVTPEGKVIYLTFDDGPGRHTKRLLNVLEKYNVKVTFFTVKGNYDYLMTAQAQAGHTVAIHSATHNYGKIYASEEAYFADLEQQQSLIEKYTGIRTTLVRFPGGSSNKVSLQYNKGIMTRLTKSLHSMGYQYFDWNVDSKDAGGAKTADEVFQNVIKGVQKRNVSVVLQHDIHGYSVDAVEMIVSWGLANGYKFLPMDATSPTAHHPVKN